MKRKFYSCIMAGLIASIIFTGCSKTEEVPIVAVDSEDDVVSFNIIPVSYDDVIKTTKIDCTYVQTKSQEVSFDTTGKYVDKVYVKNGDKVKKGDVLCELSSESLEEAIEELTYKIKKNELQLSYYDTNEQLAVQDAWVSFMSPQNWLSKADVEEQVKGIHESYDRQRLLLNDSLEFDRADLEKKEKELKASRLYATMDGTVYKLKSKLEGSTSKADTVIMTIVDDTNCLFEIKGTENKELFHEGDSIEMKIIYSSASGDYIITPYNIDEWQDSMLFSVVAGPDNAAIEVGVMGTMSILSDSRTNVLSVPRDTVHEAGDKAFVYTLNDDNIREIRYVEVGLSGDEKVEILSGLSEGEKVVKK